MSPRSLCPGIVGDSFCFQCTYHYDACLLQSVATFFSQVMAKIGGNTAGPGEKNIK